MCDPYRGLDSYGLHSLIPHGMRTTSTPSRRFRPTGQDSKEITPDSPRVCCHCREAPGACLFWDQRLRKGCPWLPKRRTSLANERRAANCKRTLGSLTRGFSSASGAEKWIALCRARQVTLGRKKTILFARRRPSSRVCFLNQGPC